LKCDFCSKEEPLPFVCYYCGGVFCADHRLPENHQCKGDLSRRVVFPQQTTSYSWTSTYYTQPQKKTVFSSVEVRDIVVAWLALGIAFALGLSGGAPGLLGRFGGSRFLVFYGISLVTIGPGFVLHELMHKFTAQRYGLWAEFRMWPSGLLLAILISTFGIVFGAPGATYISGFEIGRKENGIISVSGPLINFVIGVIFLPFLLFGNGILQDIGFIGYQVNMTLAVFNMLPIMPLDGAKVFTWSKEIWIALLIVFVTSLILFYIYIYPIL
jgi:Zn-dependent protease